MEELRCYLCKCILVDYKVYEQMFEQRVNVTGQQQNTLAGILALALGQELHEDNVHSMLICSTCKVCLLNFEALECKAQEARFEILSLHRTTVQLCDAEAMPEQGIGDVEEVIYSDGMTATSNDPSDDTDSDDELIGLVKGGTNQLDVATDEHQSVSTQSTPSHLSIAESLDHQQKRSYACKICAEIFGTRKQLAEHQRTHKPYICEYCSQMFARSDSLFDHIRIHTGERPFQCDMCPASFTQRSNLRSHVKTTHLNVAKFKCTLCDKRFKRGRLLYNHIKMVHINLRDIQCKQCNATFSNHIYYKKHMLSHAGVRPFACDICGKRFNRRENLNVHHYLHSNKKPHVCSVCGAGFMRKGQLLAHSRLSKHEQVEDPVSGNVA